jgi:pimeloyl-ACP methyl ester carboxylesterase
MRATRREAGTSGFDCGAGSAAGSDFAVFRWCRQYPRNTRAIEPLRLRAPLVRGTGRRLAENATRTSDVDVVREEDTIASDEVLARSWLEDFYQDITQVDVPTLVLRGTADRILSMDGQRPSLSTARCRRRARSRSTAGRISCASPKYRREQRGFERPPAATIPVGDSRVDDAR